MIYIITLKDWKTGKEYDGYATKSWIEAMNDCMKANEKSRIEIKGTWVIKTMVLYE